MPTPTMKLGAIDLNLLVVFDAVMQERNVTRAGQRLGSKPARDESRFDSAPLHVERRPVYPQPQRHAPDAAALPVRSALDGLQRFFGAHPNPIRLKRREVFGLQWTIIRWLCWSGYAAPSHLQFHQSRTPQISLINRWPQLRGRPARNREGREVGQTRGGASVGQTRDRPRVW